MQISLQILKRPTERRKTQAHECAGGGRDPKLQNQSAGQLATGAQEQETPADSSFVWSEAKFRILHVNIRGWISHAAELAARIRQMQERPDLICVNETFLDRTVEHIILEGYTVIARLDRSDGRKCGGIAALALTNIAERITLVESSQKAERFWFLIHAQQGPQLVGVWYRPPAAGEVATIETFKTELNS